MFNHTAQRGFFLFAEHQDSLLYFPYMAASVLCKIAVPVFFMISGAMLLKKEEPIKRVLRIFAVLILVSIPYYFLLSDGAEYSVPDFFKTLYTENATTALWYLYSYLGFLLMLPFLRRMVRGMKPEEYGYLFLGRILLTGVIPCVVYLIYKEDLQMNPAFSAGIFFADNLFYTLAGHFFEHMANAVYYSRKGRVIGLGLSAAAVAISCLMTHYRAQVMGVCNSGVSQAFHNSFVCIPAFTVYVWVRPCAECIRSETAKQWIGMLGSAVFGVYLIEKLLRLATEFVYQAAHPVIGSFLASLLWISAGLTVGLAIICGLKSMPYIKRLINWFI